ncbi:hypothetical protein VMUT_0708 [Vulcanisaeta moutnovskia 768-28]|uniref:Uncharacterized protein n=1 Tax=Vulcanisaeta moutnovskia (strain 768-28) TaxID=985053 RepID=F0QVZ5_VULM7|nr:hypothetical protein [Vulcanisaeta moutnovskia]ADY00919.1 hypothetical protein VMUT_0708 [Vulcanisaeta moutnovskia 768-28]
MKIINKIIEEFRNRGFRIKVIHDDSIKADLNKLRVRVWITPSDYFPWWSNLLDMVDELELNDINALFVVSERPYVISDYVVNNLSRIRYWFNKELNIKVYAINIDRLEEDLEDGINLVITNFYREASNVALMGSTCPNCGLPMTIMYSSRYYSRRWRTWVNEYVEVCERCKVVSHKLILS